MMLTTKTRPTLDIFVLFCYNKSCVKLVLSSGLAASGSAYFPTLLEKKVKKVRLSLLKTLSDLSPRLNANAFLLRGSHSGRKAKKV
jgi:hypothetical protein